MMPARGCVVAASLLAWLAAVPAVPTVAAGPSVTTDHVSSSVTIPAGQVWTSPLAIEEVCDFDFTVEYDDVFLVQTFTDRQLLHIAIDDVYTNRQTGFSFVDQANYSIFFDLVTGVAQHDGATFHLVVPGSGDGIEIHDTGRFFQDWYGESWLAIYALQGHHDVNSYPAGTAPYRYCEFMKGNFEPLP